MKVIIDACSFIYFLASDEQNILIQQANHWNARLAVCSTVAKEIYGTLSNKEKFSTTGALSRWKETRPQVEELSDELDPDKNPEFYKALIDLHNNDLPVREKKEERLKQRKNLGEFLSISHALAQARTGIQVIVLVDDKYGRQLASIAQQILLKNGQNQKLIRKISSRKIIEGSKPEWRKNGETVKETIQRIEKIESLPRY